VTVLGRQVLGTVRLMFVLQSKGETYRLMYCISFHSSTVHWYNLETTKLMLPLPKVQLLRIDKK
jgi:hypothetical protein